MRLHYLDSKEPKVWKYLTVGEDAPATPYDVADQLCEDAIRAGFDRLVLFEDADGKVREYFATFAHEPDGAPYYKHCAISARGCAKAKAAGWDLQPDDILGNYDVEVL